MTSMSDARKARLIGACVLVLVGFVLLSWLLGSGDHAHKPGAETAGESVIVLPARPLRTAQVGEPEPAKNEATGTTRQPGQAPASSQPIEPEPQATPQTAEPDEQAANRPAPNQPAAAARQGWYVQLGVFGSRNNAAALADKAREGDYRCEIRRLKQGGSTLHRVLVGPYPSEAAAELRVPKLQRWLGETGRVVELDRTD